MVDQISGHLPLPDDFGIDLSAQVKGSIEQFVAEKADSFSHLSSQFEVHFSGSSSTFKSIFQQFLYMAVDNAVDQIGMYLDQTATQHTLVPHEIDHLLSQASDHLKEHAVINLQQMKDSGKYRGSKLAQATQAKSGLADSAPQVAASQSAPSGGLGSSQPVGSGSEGSFQKQLQRMMQQMMGGGQSSDTGPGWAKYDKFEEGQAKQHNLLVSQEEMAIANLVLEYNAAKSPLSKDEIYETITLAVEGQVPKVKPKKPENEINEGREKADWA